MLDRCHNENCWSYSLSVGNFSITPCTPHGQDAMDGPYAVTSTLVVRPITRRGSPWRTLRAQGPPPVIPVTADCGSRMRDPYDAGPPVSARHHANTERGWTGLLRSYVSGYNTTEFLEISR